MRDLAITMSGRLGDHCQADLEVSTSRRDTVGHRYCCLNSRPYFGTSQIFHKGAVCDYASTTASVAHLVGIYIKLTSKLGK